VPVQATGRHREMMPESWPIKHLVEHIVPHPPLCIVCRFVTSPTQGFQRGGGGLLGNGHHATASEPRPAWPPRSPQQGVDDAGDDEPQTPRSVRTTGRSGSGYMGRSNDSDAGALQATDQQLAGPRAVTGASLDVFVLSSRFASPWRSHVAQLRSGAAATLQHGPGSSQLPQPVLNVAVRRFVAGDATSAISAVDLVYLKNVLLKFIEAQSAGKAQASNLARAMWPRVLTRHGPCGQAHRTSGSTAAGTYAYCSQF